MPPQDAHSGTFKVGYTFSKHDSKSSGCTFTATDTNVAVHEVKRNETLSRSGEQVNVQFERGQCTGDCLEADVTGFGGVVDNISRDLKQFNGTWTYESTVSEHQWGGS